MRNVALFILVNLELVCSFCNNPINHQLNLKNAHDDVFQFQLLSHSSSSPEATATAARKSDIPIIMPPDILGPPEPLRDLKIGQQLNAFRKVIDQDQIETVSKFTIERVSFGPDAFVLRKFLSQADCTEIKDDASRMDLKQAETITKKDISSRKNCQVAWIPSSGANKSTLVQSLVASIANLLLSRSILSNQSAGVEDLQVLKYGVGGEFILHHDGEPRVVTVIYYINGVGGTWFPLARTSNDDDDDPCLHMDMSKIDDGFSRSRNAPQNKEQALDLGTGFEPGKNGLLVKGTKGGDVVQEDVDSSHVALIEQGDALVFYNYCDDGSARLDWRALHCGLPTPAEDEEKWIANHWFRVNDLLDISKKEVSDDGLESH
jgi:hypothetical protein